MRTPARGSSAVEFALALPFAISLFLPAVQLSRLFLHQTRLECLAFDIARRLSAGSPAGADLTDEARVLAAGAGPILSCSAVVRPLTAVAVPFPRRPRSIEIIEVQLEVPGPRMAPGWAPSLRAHAREARWART